MRSYYSKHLSDALIMNALLHEPFDVDGEDEVQEIIERQWADPHNNKASAVITAARWVAECLFEPDEDIGVVLNKKKTAAKARTILDNMVLPDGFYMNDAVRVVLFVAKYEAEHSAAIAGLVNKVMHELEKFGSAVTAEDAKVVIGELGEEDALERATNSFFGVYDDYAAMQKEYVEVALEIDKLSEEQQHAFDRYFDYWGFWNYELAQDYIVIEAPSGLFVFDSI